MKSKITNYVPNADVNGIECKIYDAVLVIRPSENESFNIELPKALNVRAAAGENRLYIKQGKRRFFDKFREQAITVCVPAHSVPDIVIYAEKANVRIEGITFKSMDISVNEGVISLDKCFCDDIMLNGSNVNISLADSTVKDKLIGRTERGNIIAERSFIDCAEYRMGEGNVGLASFNGKDCTFEIDSGNITAALCGGEDEYSFSLLSRTGTCNRESNLKENAKRKFKAFCATGNISLDFEQTEQTVPTTEKEETAKEI